MSPEISGLIEPSDSAPSRFRIRLNRHEMVERQRFTLAHEIAHFLLHRSEIGGGLVDDALYRSSLSTRKEVEANKLASKLVMPDGLVAQERRKVSHLPLDEQISRLAKLFRVSEAAMRIKLGR
jgi:Zn-dependent peptidase ImmA (M78 family)